jgi:hypothetical protein
MRCSGNILLVYCRPVPCDARQMIVTTWLRLRSRWNGATGRNETQARGDPRKEGSRNGLRLL